MVKDNVRQIYGKWERRAPDGKLQPPITLSDIAKIGKRMMATMIPVMTHTQYCIFLQNLVDSFKTCFPQEHPDDSLGILEVDEWDAMFRVYCGLEKERCDLLNQAFLISTNDGTHGWLRLSFNELKTSNFYQLKEYLTRRGYSVEGLPLEAMQNMALEDFERETIGHLRAVIRNHAAHVVADTSSADPASTDPASADPASADPASIDPASADPASIDPASADTEPPPPPDSDCGA